MLTSYINHKKPLELPHLFQFRAVLTNPTLYIKNAITNVLKHGIVKVLAVRVVCWF